MSPDTRPGPCLSENVNDLLRTGLARLLLARQSPANEVVMRGSGELLTVCHGHLTVRNPGGVALLRRKVRISRQYCDKYPCKTPSAAGCRLPAPQIMLIDCLLPSVISQIPMSRAGGRSASWAEGVVCPSPLHRVPPVGKRCEWPWQPSLGSRGCRTRGVGSLMHTACLCVTER